MPGLQQRPFRSKSSPQYFASPAGGDDRKAASFSGSSARESALFLGQDQRLTRRCLTVLIVPAIVVLVVDGSSLALTLVAVLVTYLAFLVVQVRRQHDWSALCTASSS